MAREEFEALRMTLADRSGLDLEKDARELNEITRQVANYSKGLEELQKISKDTWKQMNKDISAGTVEGIKNIASLKQTMSKTFNTDMAKITDKFVTEHLAQLEKMSTGTKEEARKAEEAIQDDLVKEIIAADNTVKDHPISIDIDADGVQEQMAGVTQFFQDAFDQWDNKELGFTINADTEGAEANVISTMNSLLASGQMTAEGITAALNSIGWQPEIEYTEVDAQGNQTANTKAYIRVGDSYMTADGELYTQAEGRMLVPHIKSATKTGGGGGSGAKKGGGGGGGGAKKHEQKAKEPERYHQVNRDLARQNSLIAQNDKLKSRKYGDDYAKALEKENKLLEKQISLNKQKMQEAKDYLAADRAELESYGASFDANGNVNFYEYQKMWDDWLAANGAVEMEEEEWKKVQEQYEKATTALKNYEEAQDVIREMEESILETQNKISANLKEAVVYKMTVRIDLDDRELKVLEFMIKRYEKDLEKQAQNIGTLGDQITKNLSKMTTSENALAELLSSVGLTSLEQVSSAVDKYGFINGKMSVKDFTDAMKEIEDSMQSTAESLLDLDTAMKEFYGNTLKLGEDEMSKFTDAISHSMNMMEKYLTILDYITDGQHFAQTAQVLNGEYAMALDNLNTKQATLNVYYEQRLKLEEELAHATNSSNKEYLEQALEDLQAEIRTAEEDIADDAQSAMELVEKIYKNSIDKIMDDLDRLVTTTGRSAEWVKQVYGDWWQEDQDLYVDSITKVYKIDKLTRDIEKSIAEARQKSNQEQLKALSDQINLLAQQKELSEYDLELYQKQYELLLAQQNLENAANAKNVVRLTRDENGNMIYQYTTDSDQLAEAQQKYNDVLYEINQLTKERHQELLNSIVQSRQDMIEELNQLNQDLLDNVIDEEEYWLRREEIIKRYQEREEILYEQLNNSREYMLINQQTFSELMEQDLVDHADATRMQLNLTMEEMLTDMEDWNVGVDIGVQRANASMETYKQQMETVANAVGMSWDQMTNKMKVFEDESAKAASAANNVTTELRTQLSAIVESIARTNNLANSVQAAMNSYQQLASSIHAATEELMKLHAEENNTGGDQSGTGSGGTGGVGGGSSGGNGGGNGNGNTGGSNGAGETIWTATGSYGTKSFHATSTTEQGAIDLVAKQIRDAGNADINRLKSQNAPQQALNQAIPSINNSITSNIAAIKTEKKARTKYLHGGLADFTGPAWLDGSKGNPEYVLNSRQTSQLFDILSGNTINSLLNSMTLATQAMFAALGITSGGVGSNMINNANAQTTYNITAEFPDATDHNEIELAIRNLMNYTSQQYNSLIH